MPKPKTADATAPRTAPVNPMTTLNAPPPPVPEWHDGERVRYIVPTIHTDGKTHDILLGTVVGNGDPDPTHPDKGNRVHVRWDDHATDKDGEAKTHWDPDVDKPYAIHLKRAEE